MVDTREASHTAVRRRVRRSTPASTRSRRAELVSGRAGVSSALAETPLVARRGRGGERILASLARPTPPGRCGAIDATTLAQQARHCWFRGRASVPPRAALTLAWDDRQLSAPTEARLPSPWRKRSSRRHWPARLEVVQDGSQSRLGSDDRFATEAVVLAQRSPATGPPLRRGAPDPCRTRPDADAYSPRSAKTVSPAAEEGHVEGAHLQYARRGRRDAEGGGRARRR